MTKKLTCKICNTDRVEEETTGGAIRRLEQSTNTNQNPCKDCVKWVEISFK